tara:strand:+ start:500 stop:964 length:465 start_codon:yes stop_codon:yes gene_type:complete
MKKIFLLISFLSIATAMIAEPEKKGKKIGSGEGRPPREEVMKKFDKDGDGKLNEEEKAELRKKMAERGAGRKVPPFILEKFDKDGDGKLSEDERAEARKAMEARRAEMIEKFDKDGDGKLNEEERKAAMASRTKLGGEGKPEGKGKKGEKGEKK